MIEITPSGQIKIEKTGNHTQITSSEFRLKNLDLVAIEKIQQQLDAYRDAQSEEEKKEVIASIKSIISETANNKSLNNLNSLTDAIRTSQRRIKLDPNTTHYTISKEQLSMLKNSGQSIWFDLFIGSIFLFIPTLLNLLIQCYNAIKPIVIDFHIMMNSLLCFGSLVAGSIFYFVWRKNGDTFNKIITEIENQPEYEID